MWAVRVYDREFCDNLRKWGVVPRKTSNLEFPKFLREDLTYSFLHGLIDGDGSVSNTEGKRLVITIAGSPKINQDIKAILLSKWSIPSVYCTKLNSKGTTLTINCNYAVRFLKEMYSHSKGSFCLIRKRDNFVRYLNEKIKPENGARPETLQACREALNTL